MKLLKTFSFNQAAALLLVSLSTGCAVLRVDVDVYKGPLANHEDVQIKQFTAMAMGAKPLLISLRNNLMWRNGCDVKPPPVANEDLENVIIICRAQAVIEGWYNDDTGLIGELPLRVSPSARKVNTVLSLYDDLEDPLLQEFNAVLTGAEQKIVEATQIIKPDFEQDQRLWEKISLGFRLASEFKKELDLEQEPDSNQLNEAIRHYHNAVKKVIAPCENPTCLEDRSAKRLESSYQKLSKVLSSSQLETRDTNRSSTVPAELRLLNESDRRLKYSKVLFRDTASEQAKMFDQKLESIGQAAVAVGEGFHKIWDASIAQIVEVDTLTKFRPTRDRYVPILAKLIAQYTQPQHLAAALKIENRENEWLKKFAPGDKFWDPSGPNISDWPQTAERAIQLAFATEPVKMAQLFQELDEKFVRASEADMEKIGKVRYQYLKKSSARKFGLVRLRLSLFDSESDANEHLGARELLGLVKLREQLGTLKQLRAEGLDKGRPTKGLERIIEEYLKASERTNDPADVALVSNCVS